MASDPRKLEAHVFICTNDRKGKKECCAGKGSQELRDRVKKLCKEEHPEWKGRLRVNASGCLDHCSEGIVAVIYPEGRWLTGLKEGDADSVMKAIQDAMDKAGKS